MLARCIVGKAGAARRIELKKRLLVRVADVGRKCRRHGSPENEGAIRLSLANLATIPPRWRS